MFGVMGYVLKGYKVSEGEGFLMGFGGGKGC